MNNQIRIVILWLLLVVCMILHFDYHVSEIFYGIDVKRPDANGTIPSTIVLIRTAFHFAPMAILVILMWTTSKAARIVNLALSVLYTLSHGMHLAGELKKGDNPSQMALLSVTLLLALTLVFASWKWYKETGQNTSNA
jgi:hypothetical protein